MVINKKLLIVDDEKDILDFAANFFRKRKIEVFTALGGEEALLAVVKEQPRAALLDIKMQGIDGIETLRRMRQFDKQIKVIMVTGRDDSEAREATKELGAYGYIHKPLKLDELEKVVLKIFSQVEN